MRSPGQARLVAAAVGLSQEDCQRDQKAQCLRNRRGPSGAGNAPAQIEDEDLVQDDVRNGRHARHHQGQPRAADPVEKAEHRPNCGAEGGARDARKPELRGQIFDRRRESERRQQEMTRSTDGDEQRRRTQARPHRRPHGLTRPAVAARSERLGDYRLHGLARATQHQHDHEYEPLYGTDGGYRLRRDAARKPHVRQIQNYLHRAVGHER